MAVPYTFGSATSAIPLSQLDSNFATTITLGNTAIQLGNTVTTLNNMTLANVTVQTGNVTIGQANAVVYTNSSNVATANASVIAFDGKNIGLNVTPSAWSSSYRAVELGSANGNALVGAGVTDSYVVANAYFNGTNWVKPLAYASSAIETYNGGVYLLSDTGTTGGSTFSWTTVLNAKKGQTVALEGATQSSGTGIAFPAAQSASSDANTLDDYEEGTWTPLLYFNGVAHDGTYSYQSGSYVKVGQLVFVQGIVGIATAGTQTGNASIRNFPFAFYPQPGGAGAALGLFNSMATLGYALFADFNGTLTFISLYTGGTTNTPAIAKTNFTAGVGNYIEFAFSYRTTA